MRFQARWVEPIQSGRKTQTLRRHAPPGAHPGLTVPALCRWGEPPFAMLHVQSVERVSVALLDEDDALREDVGSVGELLAALDAVYPGIDDVVRIRFKLADVPEGSTND
jgi:hypothetical protein